MSGYNIKELVQEAQFRWLRPAEVLFILHNYEETQLNHEPPQKPPSGSLFLFNKRVLRFFRKDGHNWRRKKDGRNVGEAHERLKVGNDEALNCYYAHHEDNQHFWRRCYWMLNPAMEHIVLVHYRDTTIAKHSAGPISASTLGSSNFIQSSNNYATQLASSAAASEFDESYNSTPGPSFPDGSPGVLTNSNGASRSSLTERIDKIGCLPELEIDEALKRIQEQLDIYDLGFTYNEQNHSEFEEFYGSSSVPLQYPGVLTNSNGDNVSQPSGGMHPYSGEQSAPSRDAFNKRDSSSMMIDIDNVQEFVGDEFGSKISIYEGNSSHEVGGVSGQVPPIGDTTRDNVSQPWGGTHSYSRGQGSSYIHYANLSHEVGGVNGHQIPSIRDMARDNMSSGGTHSYSRDHSAPSWNALYKRDSSPMMIDSDSVQQFVGSQFGRNDFTEVSSTTIVQGQGSHYKVSVDWLHL